MRPDGHSGVLYTPVDPEPLRGAFPPKQLSAEAAPTDSTSTAAAKTRVLVIVVVSRSRGDSAISTGPSPSSLIQCGIWANTPAVNSFLRISGHIRVDATSPGPLALAAAILFPR